MLSNTDDRKPSPKVVCQDGSGRCCTGIKDAHHTNASRNTAPLNAPGSRLHRGIRTGAVSTVAAMTAVPMTGK